jgi:hypothetical protein
MSPREVDAVAGFAHRRGLDWRATIRFVSGMRGPDRTQLLARLLEEQSEEAGVSRCR